MAKPTALASSSTGRPCCVGSSGRAGGAGVEPAWAAGAGLPPSTAGDMPVAAADGSGALDRGGTVTPSRVWPWGKQSVGAGLWVISMAPYCVERTLDP